MLPDQIGVERPHHPHERVQLVHHAIGFDPQTVFPDLLSAGQPRLSGIPRPRVDLGDPHAQSSFLPTLRSRAHVTSALASMGWLAKCRWVYSARTSPRTRPSWPFRRPSASVTVQA